MTYVEIYVKLVLAVLWKIKAEASTEIIAIMSQLCP